MAAVPSSVGTPAHNREAQGAVSALFVIGFLTQNIQLVPVGSEYQPWIYILVIPYIGLVKLASGTNISSVQAELVLVTGLMILFLAGLAVGNAGSVLSQDVLRLIALPTVAWATAIYMRSVSPGAIRLVVMLHATFLVVAWVAPEVTAALIRLTDSRGDPVWNSYFYSEPSYAALAFIALAFLLSVRSGAATTFDTAVLGVLLLSTLSVTGIVGATLVVATHFWRRAPWVLFAGALVSILMLPMLLVVMQGGVTLSMTRVGNVLATLTDFGAEGLHVAVLLLNAVEPSGMWRPLSNLFAVSCVQDMPLGHGSFDLSGPLSNNDCSSIFAALLQSNSIYWLFDGRFMAQSIFANLVSFAGYVGLVLGAGLVIVQLGAALGPELRPLMPLSVFLLVAFVIWQSAWAAPASSLLLASWLTTFDEGAPEPQYDQ